MPPSTLIIIFDEPDKAFFPGDTVSGTVVMENQKPLNARSVIINWKGISETRVKSDKLPFKKHLFEGNELAWTSKNSMNQMPIGTYKFPFKFTLPKDCPPSFDSKHAKNEYRVKVVVDRPWKFNYEVKKKFLVNNYLSLPVEKPKTTFEGTFKSGLIFNEGPITLKVTFPTLIAKPGQTIPLKVHVTNNSSATINQFCTAIYSQLHYHAREQHTPCKHLDACPLTGSSKKRTHWPILRDYTLLRLPVDPYSTEAFIVDFEIPKKFTTPSFSTGLMTYGYHVEFGVTASVPITLKDFKTVLYIGEEMKTNKGKTLKTVSPPPYTN